METLDCTSTKPDTNKSALEQQKKLKISLDFPQAFNIYKAKRAIEKFLMENQEILKFQNLESRTEKLLNSSEIEQIRLKYKDQKSVLENIEKESQTIDICFVIDLTYSMDSNIRRAKQIIEQIIRETRQKLAYSEYRFSIQGYRDFGDEEYFGIPFTSDKNTIDREIQQLKCQGGADTAEDVFSGFQKMLKQDWKSNIRLCFHIADAPCHGRRYCNKRQDNHQDRNDNWQYIFDQMISKKINYQFIEFDQEETEQMIQEFEKHYEIACRKWKDQNPSEIIPNFDKSTNDNVEIQHFIGHIVDKEKQKDEFFKEKRELESLIKLDKENNELKSILDEKLIELEKTLEENTELTQQKDELLEVKKNYENIKLENQKQKDEFFKEKREFESLIYNLKLENQQLKDKSQVLQKENAEVLKLQDIIKTLRSKDDSTKSLIKDLERKNNEFQQQLEEEKVKIQNSRKTFKGQIKLLEQQEKNLQKDIKDYKIKLEEVEAEKSDLNQCIDSLNQNVKDKEIKLVAQQEVNENLKSKIMELERQVNEAQQYLNEQKDQLQEKANRLEEIQKDKMLLEEKVYSKQLQIDQQQESIEELQQINQKQQSVNEELEKKNQEQMENMTNLQLKIEDQESQITQCQIVHKENIEEIDNLKIIIQNLEKQNGLLNCEIDKLSNDNNQISEQLTENLGLIIKLEENLRIQSADIDKKHVRIDGLEQVVQEFRQINQDLEQDMKSQSLYVQETKIKYKELTQDVEKLEKIVEAQEKLRLEMEIGYLKKIDTMIEEKLELEAQYKKQNYFDVKVQENEQRRQKIDEMLEKLDLKTVSSN